MLTTLSETLPTLFYKPLFLCAASAKDATVIVQLRVLIALARHLPTFWTANDEMIAVALMSNPGQTTQQEGVGGIWGRSRIGQCVVMLELIAHVRKLVGEKKDPLAVSAFLMFHSRLMQLEELIRSWSFCSPWTIQRIQW